MNLKNSIKCSNCKYYHVTWDVDRPYGCNKLGFKTRIEPSTYVIQISGSVCRSFSQKNKHK